MFFKRGVCVCILAISAIASGGSLQASLPAAIVEQVQIVSEPGVILAGELHVPAQSGARPPVVLLLGGGGPSPHGIYPLLEARLHSRGIATLSFDKRGVGKSTGAYLDAMESAEHDANAALAYLRSRRDLIDVSRIAVLGLSQGGVIATTLAAQDSRIAAVVMLAAPAGQRGVMFLDEMRVKLAASGMDAKAAEGVIEATRSYLDSLTKPGMSEQVGKNRAALVQSFVAAGWQQAQAEGAAKTLSDPATSSLYTVATNDALSRIGVPVLAVYAANDSVIDSARSIPEARLALSRNHDATVVEMPNVEHGFAPQVSDDFGKKVYKGWPVSDPATLDLIDGWLALRLLNPTVGS